MSPANSCEILDYLLSVTLDNFELSNVIHKINTQKRLTSPTKPITHTLDTTAATITEDVYKYEYRL